MKLAFSACSKDTALFDKLKTGQWPKVRRTGSIF